MQEHELGVYVHVPFCRERCAYCDFAIVTGRDEEAGEWAAGVLREARAASAHHGARRAVTVHLGGGTPSRLAPDLVARLLEGLHEIVPFRADAPVALEVNAEDVTPERLLGWRAAGVTRLSIGVQSLDARGLLAIGRPGRSADGPRAIERARAARFDDVSADFIYGWPGQSLDAWEAELGAIVALGLDHASLYALELTGRTPLVRAIERGEIGAPDDDLQAAMYEHAGPRLAAAGFLHYELSNFARPGHESAHNRLYWTDGPYLGLGPAAASYVDGERRRSPRGLTAWRRAVARGELPGEREPYDADRRAGEAIVFGLRLVEGVDIRRVAARHGRPAVARRRGSLETSRARGLLEGSVEGLLRLTPRGRLLANDVAAGIV